MLRFIGVCIVKMTDVIAQPLACKWRHEVGSMHLEKSCLSRCVTTIKVHRIIIIFLTTNGQIFYCTGRLHFVKTKEISDFFTCNRNNRTEVWFFLYQAVKTFFFCHFYLPVAWQMLNEVGSWQRAGEGGPLKCDDPNFFYHHSDRWCLWLIPDSLLEHSLVKFIWQFSVVYS